MNKSTFSITEAKAKGLSPMKLCRLCRDGALIRIERGIYQFPVESDQELKDAEFRAAYTKFGMPSYISGLSALSHYNLTEQIPEKVTVIVAPSVKTTISKYQLVRTTIDKKLGVLEQDGYRIASVERALFDVFKFHYIWGKPIAAEALRKALADDRNVLQRAMRIAHRLGLRQVFDRWLPFIDPKAQAHP